MTLLASLTRSRHPSYHHGTMLKIVVVVGLLWGFWVPLYPVRSVTADLLSTTADLLRR